MSQFIVKLTYNTDTPETRQALANSLDLVAKYLRDPKAKGEGSIETTEGYRCGEFYRKD